MIRKSSRAGITRDSSTQELCLRLWGLTRRSLFDGRDMAEIVSHDDEGSGQSVREAYRQPDFHCKVPSTRCCARSTISFVEMPYFAKSSV